MQAVPGDGTYADARTSAMCAFCCGPTENRDHCPSRVFLDEPYPTNLPIVPACVKCNGGFSLDEEYLACLLSCVVAGTTEPDAQLRPKIRRILKEKPSLRTLIERQRRLDETGTPTFLWDRSRVWSVLTKLAQGHALYELHENCAHKPDEVLCFPLHLINERTRDQFEQPPTGGPAVWPEVGSRMMTRLIEGVGLEAGGWIIVQAGRYRYRAIVSGHVEVSLVLHEYLGCRIAWY
jgi:hypothetical protein